MCTLMQTIHPAVRARRTRRRRSRGLRTERSRRTNATTALPWLPGTQILTARCVARYRPSITHTSLSVCRACATKVALVARASRRRHSCIIAIHAFRAAQALRNVGEPSVVREGSAGATGIGEIDQALWAEVSNRAHEVRAFTHPLARVYCATLLRTGLQCLRR